MRTVVLASLRTHTRRYVSAALAIVVGVGFVVVVAGLSSAARSGLTSGVGAPYAGSDVVATGLDEAAADRVVAAAAESGAGVSPLAWSLEPVREGGRLVDRETQVGALAPTEDLRWQQLVDGTWPAGPGQAALDTGAAREHGLGLGDRLEVGSGGTARTVEVTALVDAPTMLGGSLYLTWPDLTATSSGRLGVDAVAWAGPAAPLRAAAPDATVTDRATYVADLQEEVDNGVDVVTILLLVFAAIALTVGVLVIANTFAILFAQRRHDLALLRCVGATRRQLLRSVRAEALALGVAATVVGLLAGTVVARVAAAVVAGRWPQARLGEATVSPAWYAGALVVGVLVTLVASWLPTRSATRADPLAALRPDAGVDARSRAGVLRLALGVLLVAGGVALLGLAVVTETLPPMLLGGMASFAGVLVLGPWLVPAVLRVVGAALGRVAGPAARLAAGNAARHPKRTATTAASLLVGVTLTTAVLTGMASGRDALAGEMDVQHPVDAVVTAADPLDDETLAGVRASDQVAGATVLRGVEARLGDTPVLALAVDDEALTRARDRGGVAPVDGQVLAPYDVAAGLRDRLAVGDRAVPVEVVGGEGFGDAVLVTPTTLARLTDDPQPRALWVDAADGADPDLLQADLEARTAGVGGVVDNGLADRAYVELQLDVVTAVVVGLLGVAILIALVGIANTLGLSVLERAREHALLRAVGLTRRQLRATLAVEAVLLSVVATLVGTAIGVAFARVAVQVMVAAVVPGAPLVLPWAQLALVVAVSAVAGLAACLLPARRAARVSPSAGLALA
ncbi:FtsX-like permease family protein [Nocardioides litoris]|uniref:FtsX-like permease family protein n=1 Tax=Nocardioides litoris TaxID=1926648 RepID=UPI00111D907D|nr:FtsX family ABC transporter permease [Nocardioides litoris]